jgi:hypothetical protein
LGESVGEGRQQTWHSRGPAPVNLGARRAFAAAVKSISRLCTYALLALGACASSSPPAGATEIDWLTDQYFGGRTSIVISDLEVPISFVVRVWKPGTPRAPGSPPDYRGGNGIGDAVREYYPFLNLNNGGAEYATSYPPGRPDAILQEETDRVRLRLRTLRGPINHLTFNALRSNDIGRLRASASSRQWDVVFATPECLVMAMRVAPDRVFTSVFVGGDGRVWDLNDAATERCALAGGLQAVGIDLGYAMSHVDALYPHRNAPNPCPLAWTPPGAIAPYRDFRDGVRCVSRTRAAWPFAVLRHAAETGKLKTGKISRSSFALILSNASRELGEARRKEIIEKEQSRLQMAGQREIQGPVAK